MTRRLRGGDERALRAFGVPHLDEAAEPARKLRLVCLPRERVEPKVRWLACRVGCHVGQPVIERGGTVRLVEPGQKVHQARERRQPSKPTASTPHDAEFEPIAEGLDAGWICLHEGKRRFRKHERDVPLEPVTQPLAVVLHHVVDRADVDEDVVAANLDREATQVVGPLVERAAC